MPLNQSTQDWRFHAVDGGLLAHSRASGTNVLIRGARTEHMCRVAPRVLQIGLLTPCNLACEFCYRDTKAPSRLDEPFLIDLLKRAAQWGVLEVAFGGGEPLLFRGFTDFVRRLHDETPLGINLTTNGTLLTDAIADKLCECVGEMRVSAYPTNHYRRTLKMLKGRNVGINWLVTPHNVGLIEPYIHDFLSLGARNVLLLGYKGSDESLHLDRAGLARLRRAVLHLPDLPLRLDVCWYPYLREVPHLFPKTDCGAGDEFLVITPDRAVQPCSFHHERIPFDTFDELRSIYGNFRLQRQSACVRGCTRQLFSLPSISTFPEKPLHNSIWIWQAHASNNSGDWTIVGRFQNAGAAEKACKSLQELARAHEAFMSSPEGHAWIVNNDYACGIPTPPLQEFGRQHGFDWTEENDGLDWEEIGCGAPMLTVGVVGDTVVVYHPYCMGLPERPFQDFFSAVGATEFAHQQYDRPHVITTANGSNAKAVQTIRDHLELIAAAEYPSEVKEPPPWGSECDDPSIQEGADRNARLGHGRYSLEEDGGVLRLTLPFENTFAGSLALSKWLTTVGFHDIDSAIEGTLVPLAGNNSTQPKTGLFGDVRALSERIPGAAPKTIVEWVFAYHSGMPDELSRAFNQIPVEQRLDLCRAEWKRREDSGVEVTWQALQIIQQLGGVAASWMREIWNQLVVRDCAYMGVAIKSAAASLPKDESLFRAHEWLTGAQGRDDYKTRLMLFGHLTNTATLPLIEQWWSTADSRTPVSDDWLRLVTESQLPWATARRWIEAGRPLSLLALGALVFFVEKGLPEGYVRPAHKEFEAVVKEYQLRDPVPRVEASVHRLLASVSSITT